MTSISFWEETKLTPEERTRRNEDTDFFRGWLRYFEALHMGITARPYPRPKPKQGMEEGSMSWRHGYLYYSWKFVEIARRQLKKEPPVLRDWMFFDSTDPQKRRFNKDTGIELLVPLEDLIKKGVVIG